MEPLLLQPCYWPIVQSVGDPYGRSHWGNPLAESGISLILMIREYSVVQRNLVWLAILVHAFVLLDLFPLRGWDFNWAWGKAAYANF